MILRTNLHDLKEVANLLRRGNFQDAAEKFVKVFRDIDQQSSKDEKQLGWIDFGLIQCLFDIDQELEGNKRRGFWEELNKKGKNKRFLIFPGDVGDYVENVLKVNCDIGDNLRIQKLEGLSSKYHQKIIFKEMLAYALGEGENGSDLRRALDLFESLDSHIEECDDRQKFTWRRANIFNNYITTLPTIEETYKVLTDELEKEWIEYDVTMRDHLVMRSIMLKDSLKIVEKIHDVEKNVEQKIEAIAEKIKIDHIAILSFFAIMLTMAFGGIRIFEVQTSIQNALILLVGLSFCLIAALSAFLGLLRGGLRYAIGAVVMISLLFLLIYWSSPAEHRTSTAIQADLGCAATELGETASVLKNTANKVKSGGVTKGL